MAIHMYCTFACVKSKVENLVTFLLNFFYLLWFQMRLLEQQPSECGLPQFPHFLVEGKVGEGEKFHVYVCYI